MYNFIKIGENMSISTADLCDKYRDRVQVLETSLISYGAISSFNGEIVTIKLNKNNHGLVEILRDKKGKGKVAVVDVGKDFYAVVGDTLMGFAYKNGWAGIVINGYVRDIKMTKTIPVGLFAIGTCPKKSFDHNRAEIGIDLNFGGVKFRNGDYIYVDEDGVVVSNNRLK
jgi:regulator of ribonuclease activity A